jgi:hypothetical protein
MPDDKKPRAPKADRQTVRERLHVCFQLILQGYQTHNFFEDAQVKSWGLSERQLFKYIRRAYARFRKMINQREQDLMTFHIGAGRQLYGKALAVGDILSALAALKEERKFLGLYPRQYRDDLAHMTDQQIDQQIAELQARQAEASQDDGPL